MREWIVPAEDIGVDGAYFDYQEILRCKDCKYHFYENDNIPYCANIDYGYGWRDEDYCSYAERKEE